MLLAILKASEELRIPGHFVRVRMSEKNSKIAP